MTRQKCVFVFVFDVCTVCVGSVVQAHDSTDVFGKMLWIALELPKLSLSSPTRF